jgi:hypothetical protein
VLAGSTAAGVSTGGLWFSFSGLLGAVVGIGLEFALGGLAFSVASVSSVPFWSFSFASSSCESSSVSIAVAVTGSVSRGDSTGTLIGSCSVLDFPRSDARANLDVSAADSSACNFSKSARIRFIMRFLAASLVNLNIQVKNSLRIFKFT